MQNKDYEILPMPLLLSIDRLYNKVRNVKYRLIRPDSLFPDEMLRYDMFNYTRAFKIMQLLIKIILSVQE